MPRGRPKGLPKSGGRKKGIVNKSTVGIKDALAPYGDRLVEGLVELTHSVDLPIRLKATETALAYIHGKPKQASDVNLSGGVNINWPLPKTRLDE